MKLDISPETYKRAFERVNRAIQALVDEAESELERDLALAIAQVQYRVWQEFENGKNRLEKGRQLRAVR